jgi:aminoglycoside phosphotransferase (APT) family kinase protein
MPADGVPAGFGLVDALNRHHGYGLAVEGRAALGETAGATFVRWPDRRRSVVTVATTSLDLMRQTAEVLNAAADRGLPVPRHEVVVEIADQVLVVQERLFGRHSDFVGTDLIDRLIVANDGFADVLTGRPDVPAPALFLTSGGPVAPRHETLAGHSRRSRHLLDRIQAAGAEHADFLSGSDLVHTDFTVPNALLDGDGAVTGIVDWNNGAARGDRDFALVKLLFDLTWDAAAPGGGRHHIQPEALEHLHRRLTDRLDPPRLRAYWAHWTLVMLHWTIRSGDENAVELHLDLGERELR